LNLPSLNIAVPRTGISTPPVNIPAASVIVQPGIIYADLDAFLRQLFSKAM
jgi:hypothetical protein